MALKKLKYNNTYIYIEEDIPDEEKGFAIKSDDLEKTQGLGATKEIDIKEITNALNETLDYTYLGEQINE